MAENEEYLEYAVGKKEERIVVALGLSSVMHPILHPASNCLKFTQQKKQPES